MLQVREQPERMNTSSETLEGGERLDGFPQSYDPLATHDKFEGNDYEDDDCKDQEDEVVEQALTEDAYSLLYISDLFSQTTLFAFSVVSLQTTMLLLTLVDMIDVSNPLNPLGVPELPPFTVVFAQCLGLILTVMITATSGDIIVGLTQLCEGYNPDIQEEMPNATFIRWLLTGSFQTCVGIIMLVDSFILAVKARTVIDLVLNLTALHFLQEVDDISFKIATMGLFVNQVQEDCNKISNLKQGVSPEYVRYRTCWKRVALIVILVGLLVPFFVLVGQQLDGRFLCKKILIEFGEGDNEFIESGLGTVEGSNHLTALSYFSSEFESQGIPLFDRKHHRTWYADRSGFLILGYCNVQKAWTVSTTATSSDPCDEIKYMSTTTTEFDVMKVAFDQWVYWNDQLGRFDATSQIVLHCNDCSEDLCQHGTCQDNYCICNDGEGTPRTGWNCEEEVRCLSLGLDSTGGSRGFMKIEDEGKRNTVRLLSSIGTLHLLPEKQAYGRSVYVASYNKSTESGVTEVVDAFVIYSGQRWRLVVNDESQLLSAISLQDFKSVLLDRGSVDVLMAMGIIPRPSVQSEGTDSFHSFDETVVANLAKAYYVLANSSIDSSANPRYSFVTFGKSYTTAVLDCADCRKDTECDGQYSKCQANACVCPDFIQNATTCNMTGSYTEMSKASGGCYNGTGFPIPVSVSVDDDFFVPDTSQWCCSANPNGTSCGAKVNNEELFFCRSNGFCRQYAGFANQVLCNSAKQRCECSNASDPFDSQLNFDPSLYSPVDCSNGIPIVDPWDDTALLWNYGGETVNPTAGQPANEFPMEANNLADGVP
ncbi:expressed unknown protein [Seminavis robusta]|uniref:Uncharacterized protein n=1 Tax=Seminavis robusta TaxID=568900 RepID=A0A9N8DY43_9STRA|nr:expressed unknown protein [Seminavis robusta]|eukprot:Sro465_g148640.1 n/a (822) ;mRNA; f:45921-48960